jgi:hypothetical protein
MWVVKGVLFGAVICIAGSVVYLVSIIQIGTARATGTTAIQAWTVQNPLYWAGCVLAFVIGVARWRANKKESVPR